MKKLLPTINLKPFLKKLPGIISRYVLEHQGAVLTGGVIVCNAAGIAATYKNSPEIHRIIADTRLYLQQADLGLEERNETRKKALLELCPLVAPIIIFFTGSTACAIVNQKQNEAKITALTAGLTLAQNTIAEYDLFKEETRKEVGEEKYKEIQQEVSNRYTDRVINDILPTPRPGEELFYFATIGKFFSAKGQIEVKNTMERINDVLAENGIAGKGYGNVSHRGNEIIRLSDICSELNMDREDVPVIADDVYWESGLCNRIDYCIGYRDLYPDGPSIHTLALFTKPTNLA